MSRLLLDEKVCPICGKLFYPTPQHTYYDKSKSYTNKAMRELVCGYSCMRRTEKNTYKRQYRKVSGY